MTFRVEFQVESVGVLNVWEDPTLSEASKRVAVIHDYARKLKLSVTEYTVRIYERGKK